MVRNCMEALYPSTINQISFAVHAHNYFTYLWTATAIILWLYFITRRDIEKITKFVFFFFFAIWLAPILDYLISAGTHRFTYYEPSYHSDMLRRYLTFFGSYDYKTGASYGIRIEVALIMLGIGVYIKSFLNKGIFRAILGMWGTYTIIFLMGMWPFLWDGFIRIFFEGYEFYHNEYGSDYYLVLLFLNGTLILYFYNKKYFIEVLKDLRFLRIGHYILMYFLGKLYLYRHDPGFNITVTHDWAVGSVLTSMGIFFACLYSLLSNNFADIKIDTISNPTRPSVTGNVPIGYQKNLAFYAIIFCAFYGFNADFITATLLFLFIGIYHLYSMPPFRLKLIPIFSKILIAANSLILFLLGQYSVTGLVSASEGLVLFFLIPFGLCLNFIDIKDYEGDKKAGVQTLPVLLGLKKAKILTASFFIFCHLCAIVMLDLFIFKLFYNKIALILLSLLQAFFILRKNYSEKAVFILYFLGIIFFLFQYQI